MAIFKLYNLKLQIHIYAIITQKNQTYLLISSTNYFFIYIKTIDCLFGRFFRQKGKINSI